MKNYQRFFIGAVIAVLLTSNVGFASGVRRTIEVLFNAVNFEVNGNVVDADTILHNGITYVPLRAVAEILGKEVGWDEVTNTVSINDIAVISSDVVEEPILLLAEFLGETEEKSGNKWYRVETKYTQVYFYDQAVHMQWVAEDIDEMFEYILAFRDLNWDGYKLPIYFLDEAKELQGDRNYYSSGYDGHGKVITMSYDFSREIVDMHDPINWKQGGRIKFKEDPRVTMLHEISHHLNIPANMGQIDKWLEEGLAYYLAYNYPYKTIDTTKYPDAIDRKFVDCVITGTTGYNLQQWLEFMYDEFEHHTDAGVGMVLEFEGLAKVHYQMTTERAPMVRYFEPSVIEFFVNKYGKEKLVELYATLHKKAQAGYELSEEIAQTYGKSMGQLETEWRAYIGATEIYHRVTKTGSSNPSLTPKQPAQPLEPQQATTSIFQGFFRNALYDNLDALMVPGEQTKPNDAINSITANFNNRKDISTVQEIFKWTQVNLKYADGEKFGRTSIDIVEDRTFTGCTDLGLAFASLSRAKGIPTVFVQSGRIDWIEKAARNLPGKESITGHILVEVLLSDGNWYLVDTTAGKLFLDYDKNNLSLPDGYYVFAKSIEVWDTGILNEQQNHTNMLNIFAGFDLSKYANPKCDYIDLVSGSRRQSSEFRGNSLVIGTGAVILGGGKESVEAFHAKFFNGVRCTLAGEWTIKESQLTTSTWLIDLHIKGGQTPVPSFLKNYLPDIDRDAPNGTVYRYTEGGQKRILIIGDSNESLVQIVAELPDDFLEK